MMFGITDFVVLSFRQVRINCDHLDHLGGIQIDRCFESWTKRLERALKWQCLFIKKAVKDSVLTS